MRVLFVDDEPRVLEALERMVLELTDDFEVFCAEGGEEGLSVLASTAIDIVVSDMRMPGMDGAAFLHEVHLRHPHVARFVLSGQTEREAAMRALRVAHQFLSKPCRADVLVASLRRVQELQKLVRNEHVRSLATGIDWLPAVPANTQELLRLLEDPAADVGAVAEVVARDPALVAKVLQVANSSFFARGQTVVDVATAVSRLGLDVFRNAAHNARSPDSMLRPVADNDRISFLQRKAVAAAARASVEVPPAARREAVTAALLSDVGQLVLCRGAITKLRAASELAEREGLTLDVAEQRVFGATHAQVGAYVLGLWGLPQVVVDAVAKQGEAR